MAICLGKNDAVQVLASIAICREAIPASVMVVMGWEPAVDTTWSIDLHARGLNPSARIALDGRVGRSNGLPSHSDSYADNRMPYGYPYAKHSDTTPGGPVVMVMKSMATRPVLPQPRRLALVSAVVAA
jgi:hypothetical protein